MPKIPLNEWRVLLRQKAVSVLAGAIVFTLFFVFFLWMPDADPAPQQPSQASVMPEIVPPEELWFDRFVQETEKLAQALSEQEKRWQERFAEQEDKFFKETRALEDALLSFKMRASSSEGTLMPGKRTKIMGYRAPQQVRKNDALMAGVFAHGVLLSGLEAKAGVSAPSDPHPVVILMTSQAVLPGNRPLGRLRHCHIVGSGYGDLSSERVYVRLEKMSCRMQDGSLEETTVSGFVVGADGRCGVRGRMAMRDGHMLARGFWGGVLSGLANILSKPSPVLLSSVGSPVENSVSYTNMFQHGLNKGGASAIDRLANYYIERAEQMQPVIQISGGQMVTVVFSKGADVGVRNAQSSLEQEREDARQAYITHYNAVPHSNV